jgi:hypothetical protein
MEAIIFGTFGIKIEEDRMIIRPFNHEDIGTATLKNVKFRGNTYSIHLERKTFTVYENNHEIATRFYGESLSINH